jgi:hypothetical protein
MLCQFLHRLTAAGGQSGCELTHAHYKKKSVRSHTRPPQAGRGQDLTQHTKMSGFSSSAYHSQSKQGVGLLVPASGRHSLTRPTITCVVDVLVHHELQSSARGGRWHRLRRFHQPEIELHVKGVEKSACVPADHQSHR